MWDSVAVKQTATPRSEGTRVESKAEPPRYEDKKKEQSQKEPTDELDTGKHTALYAAPAVGNESVVTMLLKKEASVDAKSVTISSVPRNDAPKVQPSPPEDEGAAQAAAPPRPEKLDFTPLAKRLLRIPLQKSKILKGQSG